MEVQLIQLLGLWRYTAGNVIIDFYVRQYDAGIQRGLSFFTVYTINDDNPSINYEWQGIPSIVNTPEELPIIQIDNLNATEAESIYQEMTIWSFENNQMTLQFGDDSRLSFQKMGG